MIVERLPYMLAKLLPRDPDSTPFWRFSSDRKKWPLSRALDYARQLARALAYCHDHAIPGYRLMHRDVKPTNIGVASLSEPGYPAGRVVLFDFGLAHLWKRQAADDEAAHSSEGSPASNNERATGAHGTPPPGDESTNGSGSLDELLGGERGGGATGGGGGHGLRDLTGECGSLRYMAPEVANSLPYNHLCDVFSWADVLWQMCAHRRPFLGLGEETFRKAILEGHRPPLPKKWPEPLKALLTDCWQGEIASRPEFAHLLPRLDALCAELPSGPSRASSSGGR